MAKCHYSTTKNPKNSLIVACAHCQTALLVEPHRVKRSKKFFCQPECHTEYFRAQIGDSKMCSVCKLVLTLEAFGNSKTSLSGKKGSCKECLRKKRLVYYYEHLDVQLQSARAWKSTHKAHIKLYDHERRKGNPEKIKVYKEARRARERGAVIATLTISQWNFIKEVYHFCCVYCGKKPKKLTKDHITPLVKGGAHAMDNIVPACFSCNSSKKSGPPLVPVQPLLGLVL